MWQRKGRFQREDDAVLIVERQPVMIGITRMQMMGYGVAVDHPRVMAMLLGFMQVFGRHQWEGGDPEREHGRHESGGKHASSCYYVRVLRNRRFLKTTSSLH